MIFTCEKATLLEAVNIAVKAIPSKSPLSALEGFLISSGEGTIRITGYDLKKAIYTDIDADVTVRGSIVINARFFSEMIRRMPDGLVMISSDDNKNITVKCGKVEYNLVGLDPEEYPEMPRFNEVNKVCIPQNVLKGMINQTIFAVSKEETRPIYTGSLLEIIGDQLAMVSIDGYRLARRIETIENAQLEDCSFVVPGFALSDIEKICGDSDDLVKISVGEKHISFEIGNTFVISRRLEGEFLNHRKSVPENFRFNIKIDRGELMSVIDRVALVSGEKNGNPVRMKFCDGYIKCSCSTPIGKAEDVCTCEGGAEEIEAGFNDRFMMDALKAAGDESVMLCLNTASAPCVIRPVDGSDSFTYMVLPVRILA